MFTVNFKNAMVIASKSSKVNAKSNGRSGGICTGVGMASDDRNVAKTDNYRRTRSSTLVKVKGLETWA